jgi:hypothetical protein
MAWWVATRGASVRVFQSSSAVTAKATYPTYTIAGPFSSQAAASSLAGGSNTAAPTPAPAGGCGAQAIYTALLAQGFSTVQAVGAMANAIAESSLNPEVSVIDSNGARSNGLWQFNEVSYPDSGKLITGNCAADIQQQVGYLKAHVSGQALNGSTGAEVASNFAANFERCQGCAQGGSQNATRTANAATVQGWISSGSWPTSSAGISGGSSGGGNVLTSTITAGTCVIPLNIPVAGQFCLLSKGQARGVLGVLLMIAGGVLLLPGVLVLAAAGLERTGAGAAAGKAAGAVPVGRVASLARAASSGSGEP